MPSPVRKVKPVSTPTLPGVHHTLARVYGASGHADWAAVEQKRAEEERPSCDAVPVACAYLNGKLEDVLSAIRQAGGRLVSVIPHKGTLEELFLEQTNQGV